MVMTVYGQEIPCTRAEKGANFVRAFDENGNCVFEAAKVTDFSGYALTGGEWSTAEPTPAEQVAAMAEENKLLKQQVSALTDQQSFYEDCIAEMAAVVYA